MSDLNNFSFTGRLTKDALFKTLPSGKTLLEVNVANNTGFGEYAKTNWLKVKMWGDKGSKIKDYLTKGTLISGSGELTTEEWEDKQGKLNTNLVVTVLNIQILKSVKKEETSEEKISEEDLIY